MLKTFTDIAAFPAFMHDLWGIIPLVLRLLITAVFAMFLLYGILKLID